MSKRVTKALRTVACFLGVHKVKVLGTDGNNKVGQCKYCGKYLLQDARGGWFTFEGEVYILRGPEAETAIRNGGKNDPKRDTSST